MNPPVFPAIFFYAIGVFWIFLIWVLWMIVKCLKSVDASLTSADATLKEIAESLKSKS